jgi:DNA-binding transcriptional LysR family regulator
MRLRRQHRNSSRETTGKLVRKSCRTHRQRAASQLREVQKPLEPLADIDLAGRQVPRQMVGQSNLDLKRNGTPQRGKIAKKNKTLGLNLPTHENRLRVFVESLFLVHALALDVRYEVDAIGHFVDCVEAGLASTILPASSVMPRRGKRRIAVHTISDPSFKRTITFASSEARPLGLAATHSAALLDELIKQKVQNGDWPAASLAGSRLDAS